MFKFIKNLFDKPTANHQGYQYLTSYQESIVPILALIYSEYS